MHPYIWACVYQQWWCRNSQEFPGITFIFNVVVVGTRNNTHNTIQLHTLLNVVVVGTRNNTHNTIQLHTLLNVVVVGTRNNTHNTIQLHTLLMLLLCVTYEPSYETLAHTEHSVVGLPPAYLWDGPHRTQCCGLASCLSLGWPTQNTVLWACLLSISGMAHTEHSVVGLPPVYLWDTCDHSSFLSRCRFGPNESTNTHKGCIKHSHFHYVQYIWLKS